MTTAGQQIRPADGVRPLVLALTTTPLLTELLRDLLGEFALVRDFPADSLDLDGLVRHTRPDALVIDSDQDAFELARVAEELSVPLVQVLLPSHEARVFRDRRWNPEPLPIDSPTTIRNLLLGELFHASARAPEHLPTHPVHADHGMEP
jgi:hypothetical protein